MLSASLVAKLRYQIGNLRQSVLKSSMSEGEKEEALKVINQMFDDVTEASQIETAGNLLNFIDSRPEMYFVPPPDIPKENQNPSTE